MYLFRFHDNHSGGFSKTAREDWFVVAPDWDSAFAQFTTLTGRNARTDRQCDCCGNDWSAYVMCGNPETCENSDCSWESYWGEPVKWTCALAVPAADAIAAI